MKRAMSDLTQGRKPREAQAVGEHEPASPGWSSAMPAPPKRRPSTVEEDVPPELSREELAELRGLLEGQQNELLTSIGERRGMERDTGREVGDEMDDATTEGASSMQSTLLEREVRLLSDVRRALGKMADGSYGICEGTGEPIGYSRLRLRPWARFSVAYQEEVERAARERGTV